MTKKDVVKKRHKANSSVRDYWRNKQRDYRQKHGNDGRLKKDIKKIEREVQDDGSFPSWAKK